MQLLLSVRNTIHNDGVYFHRLGHNKTLVYKGITYSFEVGKAIDFVTWPFHLYLAEELIHLIIEVVESKEVASLVAIDDPFTAPPNRIASIDDFYETFDFTPNPNYHSNLTT